jgi:hypothetical protein
VSAALGCARTTLRLGGVRERGLTLRTRAGAAPLLQRSPMRSSRAATAARYDHDVFVGTPLRLAPLVLVLTPVGLACSHDWDKFDPRLGGDAGAPVGGSGGAGASGGNTSGGAGGSGPGGGGGAAPQLVSEGLLARYFLAEAESGTAPTEAVDAAPNPLALPILQDPVMAYVSEDAHRGLHWTIAGEPGGPRLVIAGTKILDLNGATRGTIEAVARLDEASPSGSRLVHIGVDASWHFSLGVESDTVIGPPIRTVFGVTTATGNYYTGTDIDVSVGRMVFHAVLDTTRAQAEERMRVYINGTPMTALATSSYPAQGEMIALSGTEAVALGNRLINGRSIHGTLFYGAYYLVALDEAQIAQNASVLLANDDGP